MYRTASQRLKPKLNNTDPKVGWSYGMRSNSREKEWHAFYVMHMFTFCNCYVMSLQWSERDRAVERMAGPYAFEQTSTNLSLLFSLKNPPLYEN
jgi:hypothetical protein